MIAIDTNILVYAHRRDSGFHDRAFQLLKELAEGALAWGIPVACVHEFMAITTNPKVFADASTTSQASQQINVWLDSPRCRLLHTGAQHWQLLSTLIESAKIQGGQIHDARIAAICLENAVNVLWSADRDFAKFPSLASRNPLIVGK